jgi:hypothetical protein
MRKIMLSAAMVFSFSFALFSQSGGSGRTASVEMTLSPFNTGDDWFVPQSIKARYFFSDFAARLSLGTNLFVSSEQGNNATSVQNLAILDIRPGIEYHIGASKEAIPFIGLDFIYAMRNSNLNATVGAPVSGAWSENDFEGVRGYNGLGVNLVAGGDYFIKGGNFYIGTEIGFKMMNYTNSDIEYNSTVVVPSTKYRTFEIDLSSAFKMGIAF